MIDDGNLNEGPWIAKIGSHGIRAGYYRKEIKGITRSRNLGASRASGDVFLFLDDDVTLDKDYLSEILTMYEKDTTRQIGGVEGVIKNGGISYFKKAFLCLFRLDSTRQGRILPSGGGSLVTNIREPVSVEWLSGCGMSYRSEVFREFSFDERFIGNGWGDDRDFSYRVGKKYRLMATPRAVLCHHQDPAGRTAPLEFGRQEVQHFRLFFEKNMQKNVPTRLTHVWALFGIVLKNVVALRWLQAVGNLRGLWREKGFSGDTRIGPAAFFILAFWSLAFLVYPTWLLPLPRAGRVSVFIVFILYLLLNSSLLIRWTKKISLVSAQDSQRQGVLKSRWGFAWAGLAVLTVFLHLYPMGFPIRDDDDEAYHVANALTLKEKVEGFTSRATFSGKRLFGITVAGWAAFLLGKKMGTKFKWALGIGAFGAFLAFFCRLLLDEPYMQGLLHYPPLAKLLHLVLYLGLGVSEFRIRLWSLVFSILTSLLVFQMTALYRSKPTAFVSSLLILFFPNCFYYAGVAELASGALFFMTLCGYLALTLLKEERMERLPWLVLAGTAAFFYHRMTAMIFGILGLFFLWMHQSGRCSKGLLTRWFQAVYFAAVPIVLWTLLTHFLVSRNYEMTPSNLTHPHILSNYLLQMPGQIGFPLSVFFGFSFVWALFRKKDALRSLCLSWFVLGYFFLLLDSTAARFHPWATPRLALVLYVPVAILVADLFSEATQRWTVWQYRLAVWILSASLIANATVLAAPAVDPRYATYLQRRQSRYAIYDEAIPFMMKTLPKGAKIFDTHGSDDFKFYLAKYEPSFAWNEQRASFFEPKKEGQDRFLYEKCLSEKFTYVFCASPLLSKERFHLIRAFNNGRESRYLWKIL